MTKIRNVVVTAVLAFAPCCSPLFECENTVIDRKSNQEIEAVLFERNCGGTTARSYHVSLLPVGEDLPDEEGNIFIAETTSAAIEWEDDTTLKIGYPEPAEVFLQWQSFHEINIVYEEIISDPSSKLEMP